MTKEGALHVANVDLMSSQVEGEGSNQSFMAKAKAHYKKRWWLHVIITMCMALLIILPIVYVALPRISQDAVNDATLEIQSLCFFNPTATSFNFEQVSRIRSNNSYHPQIDAFNASLSVLGAAPYVNIEIPLLHATKEATILINQTVRITNLNEFTKYNALVLGSEEFELSIQGRTVLHEMRFPSTTINYNKTVTMKGLNHLRGFNITTFRILLFPDPDGANMIADIMIPNPSIMTISMGNITLSLSVASVPIGTSLLPNLILTPGNNTYPMRSTINQSLVLEILAKNYTNGILPVDSVGRSSIYNGVHLGYFEEALTEVSMRIELNIGNALKNVGFNMTGLGG